MKNKYIVLIFLFLSVQVHAMSYRDKYAAVITHYKEHAADSLKLQAAFFLIDNMRWHQSPVGDGVDKYIDTLKMLRHKTDIGKLSRIWNDCHKNGRKTCYAPDSTTVTSEYIISNVDEAFDAWRSSPWKSQVDFNHFCRYILPYKVTNEYISDKWRTELRKKYGYAIESISDMRMAFAALRNAVMGNVSNTVAYTPITLDVLSYEHIRRADCEQRCVLLASVLRAFAIPAAIDIVPFWADYSTMGHSWVSLVMSDGSTYTINDGDSEAKMFNVIDASLFKAECNVEETMHIPYQIKTAKKISKVYRKLFDYNNIDVHANMDTITEPYVFDVSEYYGLTGNLELDIDDDDPVYLCTYLTGKDWVPIAVAMPSKGKIVFSHLGTGIVYLPMRKNNGKRIALTTPVLLSSDNKKKHFAVLSDNNSLPTTHTIYIDRKYPLCNYMPNQWKNMVGAVFEGADSIDFNNPDTLAVISSIPYGTHTIDIEGYKKYRCVRYRSPQNKIALLSELSFSVIGGSCTGRYISEDVDTNTVKFICDNDCETKIKARKPGYWVGIDWGIGNVKRVMSVSFAPVSDGNGIQLGHLYELYGFDKRWRLLGRKVAKSSMLRFDNVPEDALLLLKDKTKGKEERIFEYCGGKQIWY